MKGSQKHTGPVEFGSSEEVARLFGFHGNTIARKRREGVFKDGIHVFTFPGSSRPRYKIAAIRELLLEHSNAHPKIEPAGDDNLDTVLATVDR